MKFRIRPHPGWLISLAPIAACAIQPSSSTLIVAFGISLSSFGIADALRHSFSRTVRSGRLLPEAIVASLLGTYLCFLLTLMVPMLPPEFPREAMRYWLGCVGLFGIGRCLLEVVCAQKKTGWMLALEAIIAVRLTLLMAKDAYPMYTVIRAAAAYAALALLLALLCRPKNGWEWSAQFVLLWPRGIIDGLIPLLAALGCAIAYASGPITRHPRSVYMLTMAVMATPARMRTDLRYADPEASFQRLLSMAAALLYPVLALVLHVESTRLPHLLIMNLGAAIGTMIFCVNDRRHYAACALLVITPAVAYLLPVWQPVCWMIVGNAISFAMTLPDIVAIDRHRRAQSLGKF